MSDIQKAKNPVEKNEVQEISGVNCTSGILDGSDPVSDAIDPNIGVYIKLMKFSFYLRLASVFETISCVLFFSVNLSLLSLVIIFPILGYIAAKYYHRGLLIAYCIYLIFVIVLRASLIVIIGSKKNIYSHFLKIIIDTAILVNVVVFYRNLCSISKEARKLLRFLNSSNIRDQENH